MLGIIKQTILAFVFWVILTFVVFITYLPTQERVTYQFVLDLLTVFCIASCTTVFNKSWNKKVVIEGNNIECECGN